MLSQWAAGGRLVATDADFRWLYFANPDSADKSLRPVAGLSTFLAQGNVSPDGRWLAYATNQGGGAPQVHVQSLSGTPGRWQISTTMGFAPHWTRGGRELIFEGQGQIMAVEIDAQNGFRAGTPRQLFALPQGSFAPDAKSWTCTLDGQRFFLMVPPKVQGGGEIEVVTDFATLVNRK